MDIKDLDLIELGKGRIKHFFEGNQWTDEQKRQLTKAVEAAWAENQREINSPLYAKINGSVIVSEDTIEFTYNG